MPRYHTYRRCAISTKKPRGQQMLLVWRPDVRSVAGGIVSSYGVHSGQFRNLVFHACPPSHSVHAIVTSKPFLIAVTVFSLTDSSGSFSPVRQRVTVTSSSRSQAVRCLIGVRKLWVRLSFQAPSATRRSRFVNFAVLIERHDWIISGIFSCFEWWFVAALTIRYSNGSCSQSSINSQISNNASNLKHSVCPPNLLVGFIATART